MPQMRCQVCVVACPISKPLLGPRNMTHAAIVLCMLRMGARDMITLVFVLQVLVPALHSPMSDGQLSVCLYAYGRTYP